LLSSADDANSKATAVSLISSVLNSVDCSDAKDLQCAGLNRKPCSKIPQTCGACMEKYFGEDGDSNSQCFEKVSQVFTLPKTCLGDCSGHGQCKYYSFLSPNAFIKTCVISDDSCYSECECNTAGNTTYSGSSCSLSDDDLVKKKIFRESLLFAMTSVVEDQDFTPDGAKSQIATLSSLSQNSDELSPSAADTVTQISSLILAEASAAKLTSDKVSGLLSPINSGISAKNNDAKKKAGRRLTSSSPPPLDISSQLNFLNDYSIFMLNDMVSGQEDSLIQHNFRMSFLKSTDSSVVGKTPISSMEISVKQQSISLDNYILTNNKILSLGLISVLPTLLVPSSGRPRSSSNPLIVVLGDTSVCQDTECTATFQLSNNADVSYQVFENTTETETETETYTCSKGNKRDNTHSCANFCGPSFVCTKTNKTCSADTECLDTDQIVSCDGSRNYMMTATCPVVKTKPLCTINDGQMNCEVTTFDEATTTCRCKWTKDTFQSTPRRLSTASSLSSSKAIHHYYDPFRRNLWLLSSRKNFLP